MMKFDLTKVEYSRNDLRQRIKVPEYLTDDLAYFLGFHVGDGYMKVIRRNKTVDYRLSYDGHQINEYTGYQDFVKPLIKNLFNKEVNITKTTRGTVNISFYSKAILTFLHHCCGISFSPKKNIDIPEIIKASPPLIKAKFLRGLADTDFCMGFKKGGKYPVISHATCSKNLHESLKIMLTELGFTYFSAIYLKQRKETKITSHQIDINGRKQLEKWMQIVGFASFNALTRYLLWKELGTYQIGTDINDRLKILKERGIAFPPPVTPRTRFEFTLPRR